MPRCCTNDTEIDRSASQIELGRVLAPATECSRIQALLHDGEPHFIAGLNGHLGREIALGIATGALGLGHDQVYLRAVTLKSKTNVDTMRTGMS